MNEAVTVLKTGGTILYPTETVWGLGCDATREEAVQSLLEIKKRPVEKGMIVLVDSPYMLELYVEKVPEIAWQLMDVSDSPLTIVYPRARNLPEILLPEDRSIAVRITTHPLCRNLIARLRKPIVSTSANFSGGKTPVTFQDIPKEIVDSVGYVFDPVRFRAEGSKPSSVILVGAGGEIKILRH